MNWQDLGKQIAKSAPLLGSLIAGSAGQAVGSIVANVFGATNEPQDIYSKIQADPNAALKLIELQQTHKVELEQIALQSFIAETKDKASARNREIEIKKTGQKDYLPWFLIIFNLLGILLCVYVIARFDVTEIETPIITLILGQLLKNWSDAFSYVFGSSRDSKEKSTALIDIAKS